MHISDNIILTEEEKKEAREIRIRGIHMAQAVLEKSEIYKIPKK